MAGKYSISRIEQAVEVGVKLSHSWFRGHSRAVGALTPRIFRDEYQKDLRRAIQPQLEASLMTSFQRTAPALIPIVPKPDDYEGWLFLMQHHGSPTRLLDWSESVLIALYFAVASDRSQDGELWALYPTALNNLSRISGEPLATHPARKYLAAEAGELNRDALRRRLHLRSAPARPIALRPPLRFPRMLVQQSTFTIHPEPAAGRTIPELLSERMHLIRYLVPARYKQRLFLHLRSLGISHASIFPDLEGLSRAIVDEHNVIGYAPPDPPSW